MKVNGTAVVLFNGNYAFSRVGRGVNEVLIDGSGNMTIQGNLTELSSREKKRDITAVDTQAVLEQVLALPIAHWRHRDEKQGVLHLGPMAEDFHDAFGLGADEKGISALNTSGVALAAIQGLKAQYDAELKQKDAEIDALTNQNEALAERLTALEKIVLGQRDVSSR